MRRPREEKEKRGRTESAREGIQREKDAGEQKGGFLEKKMGALETKGKEGTCRKKTN